MPNTDYNTLLLRKKLIEEKMNNLLKIRQKIYLQEKMRDILHMILFALSLALLSPYLALYIKTCDNEKIPFLLSYICFCILWSLIVWLCRVLARFLVFKLPFTIKDDSTAINRYYYALKSELNRINYEIRNL